MTSVALTSRPVVLVWAERGASGEALGRGRSSSLLEELDTPTGGRKRPVPGATCPAVGAHGVTHLAAVGTASGTPAGHPTHPLATWALGNLGATRAGLHGEAGSWDQGVGPWPERCVPGPALLTAAPSFGAKEGWRSGCGLRWAGRAARGRRLL